VKDLVSAAYWVMVGALVMPALYFTLFFPGPAYLLLIRLTMGLIGVLLAGLRDVWALLVGFGGLPAVWLTVTLLQQASRMTWSCSNLRDDAGTARRSRGGVLGDRALRALVVDRDAPPDGGWRSGCRPLGRRQG
jgi:hypothetical protein